MGVWQYMRNHQRDILYLHLHASDRFVLSSGFEFYEFALSVPEPLTNLLLLKHKFEDGDFNMNTLLEFVTQENLPQLLKEDVHTYGDFCWIDFEDEIGLDELEGREIADLLYLGHCKSHLVPPFFRKLNNQYVYLAHDDGWFNKIYYRSLDHYFYMLGKLIPFKMDSLKIERTWLGIKKRNEYPDMPVETLMRLSHLMTEGMAISFKHIQQTRNRLEIPIWVLGDFFNMDDMMDRFEENKSQLPDAKIIYQRKTKEWSIVLK